MATALLRRAASSIFKSANIPLKVAPEYDLCRFANSKSLDGEWRCSSDEVLGGMSTASLKYIDGEDKQDPDNNTNGAMLFTGELSLDLRSNSKGYVKSGFCGCLHTLKSSVPSGYRSLRMRVKTDGRTYRLNVHQTSWNPNDMYTGFISSTENKWSTVEIPLDYFLETSEGKIKTVRGKKLLSEGIYKLGITIADDIPGPFSLAVSRIYASTSVASSDLDLQDKMAELEAPEEVERVPRKDDSFAF